MGGQAGVGSKGGMLCRGSYGSVGHHTIGRPDIHNKYMNQAEIKQDETQKGTAMIRVPNRKMF